MQVSSEFRETAAIHKQADKDCGRDWQCTCAPCIQVREGMTKSDWLCLKNCSKCGYKWESRKAEPKECPQCKSRNWK